MKEIQLTQGFTALVDDEDFERTVIHKWHISKSNKGQFSARRTIVFPRINGKQPSVKQYLSRFILNNFDKKIKVDFKDDNPLNCQKYNLIITDNSGKSYLHVPRKKTLAKGVRKKGNRFHARIIKNGKEVFLGSFETEELAFNEYLKNNPLTS